MKKFLFVFGLLLSITTIVAQEVPGSIKRYDFKEVDKYQFDTYTAMVITNCITSEKEYKLRISYSVEFNNGKDETKMLYLSDGIVDEMIKAFSYFNAVEFEPELNGEKSFVIYDVGDGLFFKYRPSSCRLELLIDDDQVKASIYDVYDDDVDDIYNAYKAKSRQHVLARIYKESDKKEFGALLQKIERTFAEKGRNVKSAISDE